MKKNGFIATSVLYTFFLIFLTLFVSLIANYIHNRILLAKIDDTSKEILYKINNTRLSDLTVGQHIKFAADDNFLNSDATWIVAKIDNANSSSKKYYFISDLTAAKIDVSYKLEGEKVKKIHPLSISLYEVLQQHNEYNNALKHTGTSPYNVHLVTSSFLQGIRNSNIDPLIMSQILNPGGSYLLYIDNDIDGYEKENYYEIKRYNFTSSSQNNLLSSYCGGTFDGSTPKYNANNVFGYMNVDNEALDVAVKYISYCYYSSPTPYTHSFTDQVVGYDENKQSDILSTKSSNVYGLRLVAERTVSTSDQNTYIAGGKGTALDPYIYTDGRKQGWKRVMVLYLWKQL